MFGDFHLFFHFFQQVLGPWGLSKVSPGGAPCGWMKPAAGVMVARPAIAPTQSPTSVGRPRRIHSILVTDSRVLTHYNHIIQLVEGIPKFNLTHPPLFHQTFHQSIPSYHKIKVLILTFQFFNQSLKVNKPQPKYFRLF